MHFFLIHSTGGNPNENWFPWLADILRKGGHSVSAPAFPTPLGQSLESWFEVFQPHWNLLNSDAVLIGRSIGAPFILRLLERSPQKVKAAFLVAGFASDLGLPQFTDLISSFIVKPFEWKKIKSNCEKFFIYNSDDDPYVPVEKGEEIARHVGGKVKVFHNFGHFWGPEFPEILEDISSL